MSPSADRPVLFDADFLKDTAASHDLALIVVFGSRARGTATDTSDVDIGVLSRSGRRLNHRAIGELQVALSRETPVPADVVDLSTPDAIFRYEVAAHGRVLFEAAPGSWATFVAQALIDRDDIGPLIEECIDGVARAARRTRGA